MPLDQAAWTGVELGWLLLVCAERLTRVDMKKGFSMANRAHNCAPAAALSPRVLATILCVQQDVYSWAVVMAEMLTGELPWYGLHTMAIIYNVANGRRPALPGVLGCGTCPNRAAGDTAGCAGRRASWRWEASLKWGGGLRRQCRAPLSPVNGLIQTLTPIMTLRAWAAVFTTIPSAWKCRHVSKHATDKYCPLTAAGAAWHSGRRCMAQRQALMDGAHASLKCTTRAAIVRSTEEHSAAAHALGTTLYSEISKANPATCSCTDPFPLSNQTSQLPRLLLSWLKAMKAACEAQDDPRARTLNTSFVLTCLLVCIQVCAFAWRALWCAGIAGVGTSLKVIGAYCLHSSEHQLIVRYT